MEGKLIIWDEEEQHYITIPDGDIATHKDIHDNFIPKERIKGLLKLVKNDIELNERTNSKRSYNPEMIKRSLENIL